MKKISFGSFPFTNIDKKTRVCLDKYLIKKFADQIVLTDIFRNIQTVKDYFYLTPEVIIDQLYKFGENGNPGENIFSKNEKFGIKTRGYFENEFIEIEKTQEMNIIFENSSPIKTISKIKYIEIPNSKNLIEEANSSSGSSGKKDSKKQQYYDPYFQIVKRAFFIIRKFYERIQNDPFYKDIVVLPIYSEKLETLNRIHLDKSQYNYSFFILTNDLMNDLKLDEISFNEAEIVTALYIFIQLFPDKKLTDFNQEDYDLLIKLYNFFESNQIPVIEFFIALDYITYLFLNVKSIKDLKVKLEKSKLDPNVSRLFDFEVLYKIFEYFENLKTKNKKELFFNIRNNLASPKSVIFQSQFMTAKGLIKKRVDKNKMIREILDIFMKDKDIQSLLKTTTESLSEKMILFKQHVKLKNILILFQELVKFNSKGFNDIVKDSGLELNFKIELKEEQFNYNEQALKRKLDETFANFIHDLDSFLIKLMEKLKNDNKNSDRMLRRNDNDDLKNELNEIQRQIREIRGQIVRVQQDPTLDNFTKNQRINSLNYELAMLENQAQQLQLQINSLAINSNYANGRTNPTNYSVRDNIDPTDKSLDNSSQLIASLNLLRQNYEIAVSAHGEDSEEAQRILQRINNIEDLLRKNRTQEDYIKQARSIFDSLKFELKNTKTELAEIYNRAKYLLVSEAGLKVFFENPITTTDDYFNIINYIGNDNNKMLLRSYILDIDESIKDLVDAILVELEDSIKAQELRMEKEASAFKKFKSIFSDLYQEYFDTIYNRIVKIFVLKVLKVFAHSVKKTIEKRDLQYKETASGLHPLIVKLLKNPDNFKSFIFNVDTLLILYDLDYQTQLRKYFIGAAASGTFNQQTLPTKYTQLTNRVDYILTEKLKLENNPIWLISKSKIYLSLPDYLSLLKQRVFSNIPRDKIMSYCRIDFRKIWSEKNFGQALGGAPKHEIIKKINELEKRLKTVLSEIEKREKLIKDKKRKDKDKIKKELKQLRIEKDALLTSIQFYRGQLALYDEKTAMDLVSLESFN